MILQQTHRTPIILAVAVCNDKAVKMYEKFGFVPVSEKNGRVENMINTTYCLGGYHGGTRLKQHLF